MRETGKRVRLRLDPVTMLYWQRYCRRVVQYRILQPIRLSEVTVTYTTWMPCIAVYFDGASWSKFSWKYLHGACDIDGSGWERMQARIRMLAD